MCPIVSVSYPKYLEIARIPVSVQYHIDMDTHIHAS